MVTAYERIWFAVDGGGLGLSSCPCGPGPLSPLGPHGGPPGPLWRPWALVGPPGPLWGPWALVGPPGTSWVGP